MDFIYHHSCEEQKTAMTHVARPDPLDTALVDDAFSFNNKIPHLALSSLQTESEQSEQKGFANLLKGVFGTFRNTTAHAPKVTWVIEERDVLDILSTVSSIHRRLDGAIEAQNMYQGRS
ncbi:TIGR02391 family protein [uncultured Rheinheimera sp.]|uniref:TIGR02391 family protein n=1 Tax=uncultured Rheinheimera sp. TaxID=400532 RepID=UPI00259320C2|nr:TIGR02391 family protein [uncultured Rheinheimera sp.]